MNGKISSACGWSPGSSHIAAWQRNQSVSRRSRCPAEKIIAKLTITLDSIQQSLDDALSILTDPYRLFIEAPDPIKLMLTQAIFDKLWVMDHEVVGSELTDAFHELLTMEARLALDEHATAEPKADNLSLAPAAHNLLPAERRRQRRR